MSFSVTFFHLFLGLPLFKPSTLKFLAFTGAHSSSILSTVCAHTIITSALSRTPLLFPRLSFHELSHYLSHLSVLLITRILRITFESIFCNFFFINYLFSNPTPGTVTQRTSYTIFPHAFCQLR